VISGVQIAQHTIEMRDVLELRLDISSRVPVPKSSMDARTGVFEGMDVTILLHDVEQDSVAHFVGFSIPRRGFVTARCRHRAHELLSSSVRKALPGQALLATFESESFDAGAGIGAATSANGTRQRHDPPWLSNMTKDVAYEQLMAAPFTLIPQPLELGFVCNE